MPLRRMKSFACLLFLLPTLALAQELPKGMAAIPLNPGVIDTDMLRSCFGGSASRYPSAAKWVEKAVPFILSLNSRDSGKQLTVEYAGSYVGYVFNVPATDRAR